MRTTSKAALLATVLTALLVSLPRVTAAQDTLHKTKKRNQVTTVPNPKAPKGTIENPSFQIGASNVNPTSGNGTKAGNAGGTIGEVKVTKGKGTNKLVGPIYNGPKVVVLPTGPQPNDSAHKRPKH